MVRQEIYGHLLTHYAISALICKAAAKAGVDPDRVKFKRTARIVRLPSTSDGAAEPAALAAWARGHWEIEPKVLAQSAQRGPSPLGHSVLLNASDGVELLAPAGAPAPSSS
jgi:hypothetical protein